METDRHLFRNCLRYGQVLMTCAERHSLVPPEPAAPSAVTIVQPCVHFGLAHAFSACLILCLQGALSLALFAKTIDGPFTRPKNLGFVFS